MRHLEAYDLRPNKQQHNGVSVDFSNKEAANKIKLQVSTGVKFSTFSHSEASCVGLWCNFQTYPSEYDTMNLACGWFFPVIVDGT